MNVDIHTNITTQMSTYLPLHAETIFAYSVYQVPPTFSLVGEVTFVNS